MVHTAATSRMKSVARPGLPKPARYAQKPYVEFRRTSKRELAPHVCHAFSTTDAAANVWQRYCYSLVTNPLQTKACTSFVGFVLGDVLAQYLEGHGAIDPFRMGRLGLYGLLLDGPVGHLWYRWLDNTCDKTFSNPRGLRAVLTKTAADQLVWAPVMTCAFFAVLKMLEGHPELVLPTVQDKVLPTLVANYALWPLAHFVSFKYVPGEQRILYNNVVSIVWNCYLSMVVGSPEFANMDPTLLPPLSELASRISQSLPVHHFWLTDALSSMGMEGGALNQSVEQLVHLEQFLVWNGMSHSGAAEKLQSAAAMQFELDAAWHVMREVLKDPSFFC